MIKYINTLFVLILLELVLCLYFKCIRFIDNKFNMSYIQRVKILKDNVNIKSIIASKDIIDSLMSAVTTFLIMIMNRKNKIAPSVAARRIICDEIMKYFNS